MDKRSKDTAAAVNQALRGAEARLYALENIRAARLEALQGKAELEFGERYRDLWNAALAIAYQKAENWLELEN